MKLKKNYISLFLFVISCLTTFGEQKIIDKIKQGVLLGYPETTIGQALEATFLSPEWKYIKGKRGENIVQFSGIATESLPLYVYGIVKKEAEKSLLGELVLLQLFNQIKMAALLYESSSDPKKAKFAALVNSCNNLEEVFAGIYPVGSLVTVQFIINANGFGFNIVSVGSEQWLDDMNLEVFLNYVYGKY